jgi:hypothetical protein
VEFLLKGRVAQVSPYLLITQDPKDWPKPDNRGEIDFSLFRVVDAIHLPRICEAISGQKLPAQLKNEYDRLRRLRNRALHSVGKLDFKPAELFAIVLRFYKFLFPTSSWFADRSKYLENSQQAVLDSPIWVQAQLAQEALRLIDSLDKTECLELLEFDKSRRRYLCPFCNSESGHFFGPPVYLTQFSIRGKKQTKLKCLLCDEPISSNENRAKTRTAEATLFGRRIRFV